MIRREPRVALPCVALTLACLLVAILAPEAYAQGTTAPPKSWGQVRFGSLFITPTVSLRQMGVDTNVFNESNEPKADFTATLAPQATFQLVTRKLNLRATPEVAFVYYHTFDLERAVNPSVEISGDFQLTKRISFITTNMLGYVKGRPNYEIDARVRQRRANVSVGVRYLVSKRISVLLQGRSDQTYFEQGARFNNVLLEDTLNLKRLSALTGVDYKLTPYTAVFGRFEVMTDRFPGAADRSADSSIYSGGFRFSHRAVVQGEAEIGKRIRKSLTDVPDIQATILRGSVSTGYSDRTRFTVTAVRDLDHSYNRATPYYTAQTYSGTISQSLVGRFDSDLTFVYQGRDYGRFDDPSTVGSVLEVSRGYGASLGYRIRKDFRVGLRAMYWDRKADRSYGRGYRGWNIGFQIGPVFGTTQGIYVNEIRP